MTTLRKPHLVDFHLVCFVTRQLRVKSADFSGRQQKREQVGPRPFDRESQIAILGASIPYMCSKEAEFGAEH